MVTADALGGAETTGGPAETLAGPQGLKSRPGAAEGLREADTADRLERLATLEAAEAARRPHAAQRAAALEVLATREVLDALEASRAARAALAARGWAPTTTAPETLEGPTATGDDLEARALLAEWGPPLIVDTTTAHHCHACGHGPYLTREALQVLHDCPRQPSRRERRRLLGRWLAVGEIKRGRRP